MVNVQGDEPLIPPALIRAVAEHLHTHPECAIATACHAIHDEAAMRNPNIVKTVWIKMATRCISAARRSRILVMPSPSNSRYPPTCRYCAISASTLTVPASCAHTDNSLQ